MAVGCGVLFRVFRRIARKSIPERSGCRQRWIIFPKHLKLPTTYSTSYSNLYKSFKFIQTNSNPCNIHSQLFNSVRQNLKSIRRQSNPYKSSHNPFIIYLKPMQIHLNSYKFHLNPHTVCKFI